MPAFVKTKRDEELWAKAKTRAAEEGRPHDWPFVTGIYKNMKGGKAASGTLSWTSMSQERKKLKRKSFAQKFLREEGSAGRLRELGRSLAVAGSRPPRAQMVTIAATLDGLLDQLKQLGEESPDLESLRRRVLVGVRRKATE